MKIIQLKNVSKTYKVDNNSILSLKNISFDIELNDFIGIVGKSGSGKSTLLNMASLLDTPTSGQIFYNDTNTTKLNESDRCKLRRNIGFVFQYHYLLPDFTVHDNLSIPCMIKGLKNYEKLIDEMLGYVDLKDKKHCYPHQLSGGQAQRIAIARAFIAKPSVVFLDEPTGNLDPKTSESIFAFIQDYSKYHNITCVMVTHNAEYINKFNKVIYL